MHLSQISMIHCAMLSFAIHVPTAVVMIVKRIAKAHGPLVKIWRVF